MGKVSKTHAFDIHSRVDFHHTVCTESVPSRSLDVNDLLLQMLYVWLHTINWLQIQELKNPVC